MVILNPNPSTLNLIKTNLGLGPHGKANVTVTVQSFQHSVATSRGCQNLGLGFRVQGSGVGGTLTVQGTLVAHEGGSAGYIGFSQN